MAHHKSLSTQLQHPDTSAQISVQQADIGRKPADMLTDKTKRTRWWVLFVGQNNPLVGSCYDYPSVL